MSQVGGTIDKMDITGENPDEEKTHTGQDRRVQHGERLLCGRNGDGMGTDGGYAKAVWH